MGKNISYGLVILFVMIIAIVSSILGLRWSKNNKKIYSIERSYTDSLGNNTRTINQIVVAYQQINEAHNTLISERDAYQQELADAYREISALGIKVKNARSYTTAATITRDTFTVVLYDTVYIENKPFKQAEYSDGYLYQEFQYNPKNNKLFVNYHISDTVMVVDSWVRQPNKKGEQVFYLWRWVKPWTVKVDVKSKNPKSEIINGKRILLNTKKR